MNRDATRIKIYTSLHRRLITGKDCEQPKDTDFPIARIVNESELPGPKRSECEALHRKLDKVFNAEWNKYQSRSAA